MAVFAPSDMRKMRQAHGFSAADLAELVACDSTTITRYETGKLKPNPDIAYQICEVCGEINNWEDWMRTEYPISYGRVHPEVPRLTFEGTLMRVFAEIEDVATLQREALRDGSTGNIDDPELRQRLRKECSEAASILQSFVNMLDGRGGGTGE